MDTLTDDTNQRKGYIDSRALAARLDRAKVALRGIDSESTLIARLDALYERLCHSRLHLAVLGQFKRGKSTLINALLGVPLLPIAVVPLTAVPTFIFWRSAGCVRVRFRDNRPIEELTADDPDKIRDFLFRFVAEEANPKNHLGVERVDLFYPASILSDGTVLIDTPGVGSTLRHNTEAAFRILPECDAVLFVVSADPPITEVELDYLRRFEAKSAKIIFVLNKIDYLRADERTRVAEFLHGVLEQNGLWTAGARIFSVSARDGMEAKLSGDRSELQSSGVAEMEAYLGEQLAAEKTRLLQRAIRGKALDVLSQACADVSLRIRALEIPLEDLASKCDAFEKALQSIQDQRKVTDDLLGGEQRRVREELERRIETLRKDAALRLAAVIDERIAAADRGEAAQRALGEVLERLFENSRQEFATAFATTVNSVLSTHQRRIDALIDAVRRTAADIFDVPFRHGLEPETFELGEEPYWLTANIRATLIPDPSRLIDRFLPTGLRTRRVRRRLISEANGLVIRNAENLRWAVFRGIDETFRQAGGRFEERLDDAIAATQGAIQETLVRRRDRTYAIDAGLNRLKQVNDLLATLQEELLTEETEHSVQAELYSAQAS